MNLYSHQVTRECRAHFARLDAEARPALAPVQIRTIKAFASVGHGAAFIARQVDLSVEVVKQVLEGH